MADPRRRPNAITWVAPPEPEPRPTGRLGPCWHCRLGAHHMCTGVGCYRCPRENHPRAPGVAGEGQQPALGRDDRRSFHTEKLGG